MIGCIRSSVVVFFILFSLQFGVAKAEVPPDPDNTPACAAYTGQPEKTLSGAVSDPTGARVAGATITAECGEFRRETRSDTDGAYSLTLPAGTYRVRFEKDNLASAARDLSLSSDSAGISLDVTLVVEKVQSRVTVTAEPGYAATATAAGTKTETSLLEVPQSISVVNRQLLDDQGVNKLEDALKNVAGVMPGGYHDSWDYYRIRGFDASFNTYVDGLRGANGMGEEIFALEDIEILKGPSSMLYGQSVLGGLINLRTKRPRPDAFADIQFTGGQFGFYEPAIDAGASLNSSHTLYGRLTALYRPQDSFVDYAYKHRAFVAPALTWQIGPDTRLTLLGRYEYDRNNHDFPLPAVGTVLPNINGEIPISRYTGEPGVGNPIKEADKQVGYEFSHRFNDRFSVYQKLRLTRYDQNWQHILYSGFLSEDERILYRYPLSWHGHRNDYAVDTGMQANLGTGAVRHNVLFGVDFFHSPDHFLGESIDFADTSAYMPLDLFNPVYGTPLSPIAPYTSGDTTKQYVGYYLQDQAKLTERLTVTAGGRIDFASNRDKSEPDTHRDTAFTPRVGVTYQVLPGAALFASYSKSFFPQAGRVFDGSEVGAFVSPEKGEQWEGGIKTALLGGRASTTLSVYHLSRENVTSSDPVHPNFYLLTGKQRSRGVELETALRLLPGWNLTVAYAYTDAIVTEDNTIPIGTPTQNVPKHTFNAWTTYELQRGRARGLGFGFGGRHYTDQSGDLLDTFSLPAYGVVDASAFYRRGRFRWQINVNNLASTRYFTGSYDAFYVKPGEPRDVRTTVGWSF